MEEQQIVNNISALTQTLARVRDAQRRYADFTQQQVDAIFAAAAAAAARQRIPLAKMAVAETGMGVVEDKVIKNHYAAENIYNAYKDTKTCGVIEEDTAAGLRKIAEPLGVIAAVIPTTNPTSTTIFKILLALKTRNGIIISPHPRAKGCTVAAARILLEAAVKAGAPDGLIAWIDAPNLELTNTVMRSCDIILATGGPGMVKSAYSSGKPAVGVGAGNTPAVFDSSADIVLAVNSVVHSKVFDNGMICASEQAVIAMADIYDTVKQEFIKRGCYFLKDGELDKVRETMIVNGALNGRIVGQTAPHIAALSGVTVPPDTKILIGEVDSVDISEPFAHEKLSPVLALYKAESFPDALDKADTLVQDGGFGHTASIYIDTLTGKERLRAFEARLKACRILVNTPAAHGGIGDLYNFRLPPSLTLGCGSWGGNSTSENVGVKHLLNIKTVAERRENMLWFRTPPKVYCKRGCLPFALEDLRGTTRRAFVVTDRFLFQNGYTRPVTDTLTALGIDYDVFYDVEPDPTLASARAGAARMAAFRPDCVIALGGGSPIDAAKVMWVLYEHPEADFNDMAMRFMDIRKRVYRFPAQKIPFIAIPTTAGTGSEVTPFAVITDEQGIKYPLADYSLTPTTAIVDADLMMHAPKGLTAASGIDAVTHALEAYASMLATESTDALALQALKLLFRYLPDAYQKGADDPVAREKVAEAAMMAGMAFANAFLGICHSMAHKLGAFFHLPHGIANALLINEVIAYNAAAAPTRMGSFSQYGHPKASARYAALADELGLSGASDSDKVDALISAVENLKAKLDILPTIAEYGIDEQAFTVKLDEMSELAFDDQCTGSNPRYPLIAEIKALYQNAYYGKGGRGA